MGTTGRAVGHSRKAFRSYQYSKKNSPAVLTGKRRGMIEIKLVPVSIRPSYGSGGRGSRGGGVFVGESVQSLA